MSGRRGVPAPNYTQAPNVLLDELLPEITTLSELKVTLVVVRHTIGWHEDKVKLTFTELQKRTGLSRPRVNDGIKAGLKRGTIERRMDGAGSARDAHYALNLLGYESQPSLVTNRNQAWLQNETEVGSDSQPSPIEGKKEERNTPNPLASEGAVAIKWGQVLESVERDVPPTTFMWLEKTEPVSLDGDVLEIRATASDGQAAFVRGRFLKPVLEPAAARVFGNPALELVLPESDTERAKREREELLQRRRMTSRQRRRSS